MVIKQQYDDTRLGKNDYRVLNERERLFFPFLSLHCQCGQERKECQHEQHAWVVFKITSEMTGLFLNLNWALESRGIKFSNFILPRYKDLPNNH